MKKFLLGVIFIIPIIVMIAITAASSIIAVATSPLPETIKIFDEDGRELENGDEIKLEITDKDRFITIEVGPMLVQDDSLDFSLEEESGEGRLLIKRKENTDIYQLVPQRSGAISVTIRANANINLVRSIIFVINTQEITGISIFNDKGNDIEQIEIINQTQLFVAVAPVVALDGNNLSWKSSDENIVKVSTNGMLYPNGIGKAYVSVSAKDKLGQTHSDSVLVDTTHALVKSNKVFTSHEITMSWIYQNVVVGELASVSKIDYTNYIVSDGINSINLTIGFCESDEWDFADGLDVLYTRSVPYFANIRYLDITNNAEVKGVTLTSDNHQVLSVDGNTLIPQKGGIATITAKYGQQTKTKIYVVKENPAVLNLSLTAADAKLGIKLTRTWGLYWFDQNNNLTSTYKLSVNEHIDVVWQVDDETKASVTQDGLITFKEACRGRKVTVTASTLAYGRLTGVSRSFTFNMQSANAVNVYSFDQLTRANDYKTYVLVLQNNLDSPYTLRLHNSLYGNGFTVSAEVRGCNDKNNQDKIFGYFYDNDPNHYNTLDTVVVEDLVIVGRSDLQNAAHNGLENSHMPNKVVFRYIVARNFHTALEVRAGKDTLIEGCILGDNGKHSISIVYNNNTSSANERVTLRNNIIKMSQGPAVIMIPERFDSVDFGKNIIPELVIDGFLDIYNWKTESQVGPAFNVFNLGGLDLGGFIDPKYLEEAINNTLADLMVSKSMSHLFYKDKNGDRFASMGVFVLGAMFKPDKSKFIIKDKNLTLMTLPLKNVDGTAGMIIDIVNAIAEANGMPINNSCYFIGYNFTNREPEVKPGDAVPQNIELYQRLQSGVVDDDSDNEEDDYDVC